MAEMEEHQESPANQAERKKDDLDSLLKITGPKSWLALMAVGLLLLATFLWFLFGAIEIKVAAKGVLLNLDCQKSQPIVVNSEKSCGQVVYGFFPIEEGQKIKPGQKAEIKFYIFGQKYGYLKAQVKEIQLVPISEEELAAELKNSGLAQYFFHDRQSLIKVILEPSIDRSSGKYEWSSHTPPAQPLESGLVCVVNISLEQISPISLFF